MPTKNPRITVNLDPHVYETLTRLSELQGESMSSIVCGFLDMTVPAMERMVVAMQWAKDAPQEARRGLKTALDKAEARLLPSLVEKLQQHDMFLRDEMDGLGLKPLPKPPSPVRGAAERRRVPGAVADPRLVTRGSGRLKKAHTSRAKGGSNGTF